MSPLPSGVPTHSSDIPSDASVDPAAVTIGEDGVPALNLGRINEARAKRHNANPRTYPDPSSSVVGTTAEIGPNSDASAIRNAKTLSTAAGSYRMPAPLQTVSATQSLESHQAQLMARAAVTEGPDSLSNFCLLMLYLAPPARLVLIQFSFAGFRCQFLSLVLCIL